MFKKTRDKRFYTRQAARAAHNGLVVLSILFVIVTLSGCKPTASAMQAPPLAEPVATPTIHSPATLDDIAGWWKTSLSMDGTKHIEPDGTWREFGIVSELGPLPRGGEYRGSWQPKGNLWELRHTHGPTDASCENSVGIYDIQMTSRDSARATLVEDPCGYATSHKDVRWTRATQLERLLGTWIAEGEENATVAFRSDLTYTAWHGTSPTEGQVVWGEIGWNQPLEQLELKDKAQSPCGPTMMGKYQFTFGADGGITFECIEDVCAERRRVITEWGPFHGDKAYSQVAGRYVSVDQPQYELLLTACGTQRLRMLPDDGEGLLREGSYSLDGPRISFVDTWGDARCPQDTGIYEVVLDGDTLRLEVAIDGCQARANTFAACPTWTRTGSE